MTTATITKRTNNEPRRYTGGPVEIDSAFSGEINGLTFTNGVATTENITLAFEFHSAGFHVLIAGCCASATAIHDLPIAV